MNKQVRKGFTLIELLIVVSIIGILSVALVPSITDAPKRARDAARKTMVNTVVAAVESYNLDKGTYPVGNFCLDVTPSATGSGEALLTSYVNPTTGAPKSAPAVSVATAVTEGVPPCTDSNNTYVYYTGTASGYTVAIRMELAGKGTHSCDTTVGAACTAATGTGADYFAVVR